MPKGPKGGKRSADVISAAVKVMQIATGEAEEEPEKSKNKAAVELGRKGGRVRAERMALITSSRASCHAATVPSEASSIRRVYPATSAASIAASLR
jgi:hypothetical protein